MPTETRYMRNARSTVNGLYCFELKAVNTTAMRTALVSGLIGIRVWKRTSGGAETEITAGTPVAQVTMGAPVGYKTNTWNCPETALAETDSIVVRAYYWTGSAWALLRDADGNDCVFQTEQLGTTILNASTWTIYYYYYENSYWGWQWGSSTRASRIENFAYGAAALYVPNRQVFKAFPSTMIHING